MDELSLQRLEFPRVTAAVAAYARDPGAARRLESARPLPAGEERSHEIHLLAEALRRHRDPGEWSHVGRGEISIRFEAESSRTPISEGALDGPGLVEVLSWLEAGERTRAAWLDAENGARYPGLRAEAASIPTLGAARERLARALEPDGRVSDAASPALKRARVEVARGERDLQERLERWARPFGESSYVTRHGDRFVALVPAAGFPRRRAIVHDVSGSEQSLFVEPIEHCEANNRLIELRATATEEERRVLAELRSMVLDLADEILDLARVLIHFETLRARAQWAAEIDAIALSPDGDRLRLVNAYHPLLASAGRDRVVPLDLELDAERRLLLVSGPNMGGKTVLLKTVGLAAALAHAAFPVPTGEGSAIPRFEVLLADLGDEQSLDQGLSTFAAHLRSLAAMADAAGPQALLLCDELGAGTDPEEGAALGRALIERFAARGAWGIVTTHLGSLKRVAGDVPGVVNGSLEFDAETMTPRYRFVPGIPGASRALAMAERLGFDAEILARAHAITPEESRSLERLLEELSVARRRMDETSRALDQARREAEREAATSRAATEQARSELEQTRRRLTHESEVLTSHARDLWQTVQREAKKAEKTRAGAEELRARIQSVEGEIESLESEAKRALEAAGGAVVSPRSITPESLAVGSRVRVLDLGVEAVVAAAPDAEGKVQLRRGSWSITSHVSRLVPLATEPENGATPSPSAPASRWELAEEGARVEIDLRGMDVDESLRELDRGLDRAVLSGLSELRIVHGVGRGVLRVAVEKHLRAHPQIASWRTGLVGEGGRGVTVATLR